MEVECPADSKEKEGDVKRVRRRRKKIYQTIRQQMEFYFSDANLTKDRFLSKLTMQDPYVDLKVFLGFNKIRALTNSMEELANALSKSEVLSLSEDRTKVARLTPIQRNVNEDECSIYVEGLPADAKHEWLQEVFSVYGKVVYVSIPKYRHNGKIKGFAFVEFDSSETANKALEAFQGAGCCLPTDMAPEQLCSVTTFEPGEGKWQVGIVETHGEEEARESGGPKEEGGAGEEEGVSAKAQHNSSSENVSPSTREKRKKRQRRSDGNEDDVENEEEVEVKLENLEYEKSSSPMGRKKKKKQHKREGEEENAQPEDRVGAPQAEVTKGRDVKEEAEGGAVKEKKKRKRRRDNSDEEEAAEEVFEEEDSELGVAEAQKKRKRKKEGEGEEREDESERKRSRSEGEHVEVEGGDEEEDEETGEGELKRKRKKRNRNKREKLEGEPLGLRILSKKDWKRLRNKYLQLQRKNMQMLRSQMMEKRWCNYWGGEGEDHGAEQQHLGGDVDQGKEASEGTPKEKANQDTAKPRVQFVAGVIVKIQFKEPLESARKFKDEVKNLPKNDSVAYIDVKDAATTAYIRCHSSEAAKELMKDIPWEDRKILEGGEEKEYWDKIMKDREEKIDKKIRVNQRGRDKILRKAENLMGKHLRYDN